jgi:putative heme-binding domain-containing protein
LRREAVRTLVMKTDPQRAVLLMEVARGETQSDELRADAVAGLSAFVDEPSVAGALEQLRQNPKQAVRKEAERVLRVGRADSLPHEEKPGAADVAAWAALLEEPGDAAAGRRIFFSHAGPRCSVCHRHDGRGGLIAPDLTHIGRVNSRERIITSILQPSQEIAPHYQPWLLTTKDGKTLSGLRLAKAGDDGVEPYADAEGNTFQLPSESIEDREASQISIMPEGLEKTLSIDELRDLVTFLTAGEPQRE